ncbi:MAG TPA: hypothetical protein DCX06_07160 [Opitutae bacterium]|nr:hypothetical protein [Opitutae bacterium]
MFNYRPLLYLLIVLSIHNAVLGEAIFKDLDLLEAEITPYYIPKSAENKIIPRLQLENTTFADFIKILQQNGVKATSTRSLKDVIIDIKLRQLSILRCIEFITAQTDTKWIHADNQLYLYKSLTELDPHLASRVKEKTKLEELISLEENRVHERLVAKYDQLIIDSFEVTDLPLSDILARLGAKTRELNFLDGGIGFIPLFNPESTNPKASFTFRDTSLKEVLDTIIRTHHYGWRIGNRGKTVIVWPTGGI